MVPMSGTDVQYRASTDEQLPAKLPFGDAPVAARAYASTTPVLQILLRYWRGTKSIVNFHLGFIFLQNLDYTRKLDINLTPEIHVIFETTKEKTVIKQLGKIVLKISLNAI